MVNMTITMFNIDLDITSLGLFHHAGDDDGRGEDGEKGKLVQT